MLFRTRAQKRQEMKDRDMPEVFTLGEALGVISAGRLRHDSTARLDIGGPEFTTAIGLVRLGHSVMWVGRVGRDELGARVLSTLHAEGLDVSTVRVEDTVPTGMVLTQRPGSGPEHTLHYRAGSAGSRLSPEDVPADAVRSARLVHVTGITPAISGTAWSAVHHAVRLAREAGVPVSMDVGYREGLWKDRDDAVQALTELARGVDVLFANQEELQLIGAVLGTIPEVVITRGAKGASATVNGMRFDTPAAPVVPVDLGGAGSAFVAGYLSALLEDLHPADRLKRGSALAGRAVASPSRWLALPTRDTLPSAIGV
jgi:2-dehydro-3-deoxygluconokinase